MAVGTLERLVGKPPEVVVGATKSAVTLITKNSTNPFFVAMQKGAKEAGEADGVKLTIVAGKADGDEAGQVAAIEEATARGERAS